MKSIYVKLLNASRRSTESNMCTLRFRRYSSKSDGNSEETANGKIKQEGSTFFSDPDSDKLEKFEYPDVRMKSSDYIKPFSYYVKDDIKNSFSFLKRNKTKDVGERHNFPYQVEFLIIGAGPMGSSIAFWLQKMLSSKIPVLVVDKNLSFNEPTDAAEAVKISLQSSMCTLKQEYELKENVELSQFGADFIRNMDLHADIPVEFPEIPFQPFGFLTLSNMKNSEILKKIHSNCLLWKGHNELLTPYQLNQRYPWLNTNDVELAIHGLKNEGWFDPDIFLMKLRSFAVNAGAKFVQAEPIEFVYDFESELDFAGFKSGEYLPCNQVYLKLSNGEIRKVEFAMCIIALGPECGSFAKEMLRLDTKYRGMHHFEMPIIPRKRRIFCVACPESGPGISSPIVVDPTGLFIKRYGPINEFICGCPPLLNNKSFEDMNDRDYFEQIVWPLLANRIPIFENLHMKSSTTYYEDFNMFDGSPIVGAHPAYHNFFFVTGFGDRCHQHAPGIGRAVAEIYRYGFFKSIDISRFSFNRLVQEVTLLDSCLI